MEPHKSMDSKAEIATREAIKPNFDTIPHELIESGKHWGVWKYVEDERGLLRKPFHDAVTGRRTSVVNLSACSSFEVARKAYETSSEWAGISYVLTQDQGLVALDFDDCIDENGQIDPRVETIIKFLSTYFERSPGKRGVRGFIYARLPGAKKKQGKAEMYEDKRHVSVTGAHLDISPMQIAYAQDRLNAVYKKVIGPVGEPVKEVRSSPYSKRAMNKEQYSLTEKIEHWKKNDSFRRYFDGDTSLWGTGRKHGSKSDADYTFCLLLVFRGVRDETTIDEIFRMSKLFDEKWDSPRGDITYSRYTIKKALAKGKTG